MKHIVLHRFEDQAEASDAMEALLEDIMLDQEHKPEALAAKQRRLLQTLKARRPVS